MNRRIADILLRVGFGTFMFARGWEKLIHLIDHLGGQRLTFADPLGIGLLPSLVLAIFAELVCSALVILGIQTRYAAWPIVFSLFLAAFVVHKGETFAERELTLVYMLAFAVIGLVGQSQEER